MAEQRHPPRWSIWITAALLVPALPARGAAPELRVPDGFEIRRVAPLDLVERPICADLDDRGRLYVAESSGSNEKVQVQLEQKPHRILCLEDVDGDGVYDRRSVFADRMMFPEGILWHDGAVYCGAPPSIWKLRDTDGDGVADERSEWWQGETLTGCANDIHGPYAGPDGYIYWCKGAFARQTHQLPRGRVLDDPAAHIYRCRPDGSDFDAFMSGGMDNPVEIAWDAAGNLFFTTTFFNHPRGGKRDAIVHGVYGAVYPKVHGVLDGLERTGELMPAMTHLGPAAPCGLCCYHGDAFGAGYRGDLFCCQFNTHKVSRHSLQPSGSTFVTTDTDFVTSDSPDFHPTDVLEDRDGSLIVIDTGGWYKLCCPTSQMAKPEVPGGIYRVRRIAAPVTPVAEPVPSAVIAARSPAELLGLLAHHSPNVRLAAAAALARQPDPAAVAPLLAAAGDFIDRPLEHALIYALIMIADPAATRAGLASDNPHTWRAAMIALDQIDGAQLSAGELRAALESGVPVVADAAWWVYGLHPERGAELVGYFDQHPGEIAHLAALRDHAALRPALEAWVAGALASHELDRVAAALPVLRDLDAGARAACQDDLLVIGRDESIPDGQRLDAIELLADPVPGDLFPFLHGQSDSRAAAQLARVELDAGQRDAVIGSLGEANALQLPQLLRCFRAGGDAGIGEQIVAQLGRSKCLTSLQPADIDQALGAFPAAVRASVLRLVEDKKRQLADPARLEKIAAELPAGDPARGHLVFNSSKAACFTCHAIGYRGGDFGPDLSRIGSVRTERDLLEAIVFPGASVVRSYEPVAVDAGPRGQLLGIISDRSDTKLSLRIAPLVPPLEIPAASVRSITPMDATSLMPSGLDEQLSRQELADLIAFLRSMR